jgi:hypothetical protein
MRVINLNSVLVAMYIYFISRLVSDSFLVFLSSIPETLQVTEGRKYFARGQPCFSQSSGAPPIPHSK